MNYTNEEKNLILLCSIEGLSYKDRASALLKSKNYSRFIGTQEKTLIKKDADGVYNKVRAYLSDRAFEEKVFKGLNERGVECVTLASAGYPQNLREIPSPPITLFCKGDRSLLNTCGFAIVGSRHTRPEALALAKKFSKELAAEFTLITGTATGADSAALEAAEGRAMAVLAFGFDYVPSQSNAALLKKVEKRGLLVSEYSPATVPRTFLFPARNRIIAALSEGVLVVSAGAKSGALITADYAEKYGKELFAVPYFPGTATGEGCNGLIKDGALPATCTGDIFSVFGIEAKAASVPKLGAEEAAALKFIKERGEALAAQIAEEMGLPAFKLIPVLSSLEIKGLIVRLGGNRYAAL